MLLAIAIVTLHWHAEPCMQPTATLRSKLFKRLTSAFLSGPHNRLCRTRQAVRVTTFIATLEDSAGGSAAERVRASMDPSCKLPADERGGPWLVVGTLDVNQGARLPAEELIGWEPPGAAAAAGRAYLSNVCVHAAVRRQARVAGAAWQRSCGGRVAVASTVAFPCRYMLRQAPAQLAFVCSLWRTP